MTYSAELLELIEEFQEIDDKMERLEMVFDLADEVNLLPIEQWTDSTRVHGCQSEAHVKVEIIDSSVNFYAGADSKLVQGLMGILTMAIHGIDVDVDSFKSKMLTLDAIENFGNDLKVTYINKKPNGI